MQRILGARGLTEREVNLEEIFVIVTNYFEKPIFYIVFSYFEDFLRRFKLPRFLSGIPKPWGFFPGINEFFPVFPYLENFSSTVKSFLEFILTIPDISNFFPSSFNCHEFFLCFFIRKGFFSSIQEFFQTFLHLEDFLR